MNAKIILSVLMCVLIGSSFTFKTNDPKKPWPVPDVSKNKKNPVKSDAQTLATGKSLWNTHCKSCHGAKGLGDGSKAAQLDTEPGDFTLPIVQTQTDGSLFFKTTIGRDDMPAFKKKIADEDDRWAIVNYIKTLKK
ncbi:Cytochrome C oxidase, cbb3-type, subunit III [Daejeonella rubra]|uniref:Cytochrome C oxidase, cbb3-type, subunit III n=1 Tax=Daejeonella rubra TaxID=990371 RepID=A0A1G9LPA2_9SPHI|nr:cytochrome c [Daejeonella rubra]SDL63839.1 Cytochrome C oxidase, cbb3-type, subunit III [Daejeonella rubra]